MCYFIPILLILLLSESKWWTRVAVGQFMLEFAHLTCRALEVVFALPLRTQFFTFEQNEYFSTWAESHHQFASHNRSTVPLTPHTEWTDS